MELRDESLRDRVIVTDHTVGVGVRVDTRHQRTGCGIKRGRGRTGAIHDIDEEIAQARIVTTQMTKVAGRPASRETDFAKCENSIGRLSDRAFGGGIGRQAYSSVGARI